jgi:hypothetical protein
MAGFLKQLAGAVGGAMVEQADTTLDEQRLARLAKLKEGMTIAAEGRGEARTLAAEGRAETRVIGAEGRRETRDIAAAGVRQEGAMELQKLRNLGARDNLKTGPKSKTEVKDEDGNTLRTMLHNYDGTTTVIDHVTGEKTDFKTWAAAKKAGKRNEKEAETADEWMDILMPKTGWIDTETEDAIEDAFGGDDAAVRMAVKALVLKRIRAGEDFNSVRDAVLNGTLKGEVMQSAPAPKTEDDPMDRLPDPATKEGKTLTDPKSKRRFVSDGATWKEV